MSAVGAVTAAETSVFPRLLDHSYPNIERGEGVRLYTSDGSELLDACSGGAMVACLGHGASDIVRAARDQAQRISYVYNHHFSNEPQERLAARLIELAAPEMARVRFVSGGSEANETALRLVRQYHVDRGEPQRWRIISQAQSYHGALMGALALTGSIRGEQPERWRIECRRPGADANPYLALAALAASAADGIRHGASPPPPVLGDACAREDLPALPGSLESAPAAFDADGELRAAIGETFCEYYRVSRAWELEAWRDSVSDWERERYERAV